MAQIFVSLKILQLNPFDEWNYGARPQFDMGSDTTWEEACQWILKVLRHGLCNLKNLALIFQVRHLQSVLIFSIPILVPFWFILDSVVFVYPGKLLFQGFLPIFDNF